MMRALITGASRGIGAAIAERFAKRENVHLFLCYRTREAEAERVAVACRALGAAVELIRADLNDRDEARSSVQRMIEQVEGIDVLVNNAGLTQDTLALRMTDARWDEVMDVNLSAPFFLCKAALKPMIRQRYGRIINLSSIIAQRGRGGQVNYAASKGGIEAMTRALAVEVASRGITVNSVAPGWIDTEMTAGYTQEVAGSGLASTIPAARTGRPEEVATLIDFLASREASYITGQVIAVDGGLSVSL